MIRQNRGSSIEELIQNSKAVLEHMFDNHEYCNNSWCGALKAKQEGKLYHHPDKFCTRATADREKMYQDISTITGKYGSAFFLKQS